MTDDMMSLRAVMEKSPDAGRVSPARAAQRPKRLRVEDRRKVLTLEPGRRCRVAIDERLAQPDTWTAHELSR